jgi:predicted RNA-binding protein
MPKYWLIITNKVNWLDIKTKNVFGFNQRNKKNTSLLSVGDILVFYIIPKQLGGIFKIRSLRVKNPIKFGYGDYPNQIKIKKILVLSEAIIIDDRWEDYQIVEKLELFKNKKRWGAVLMGKTILALSKNDYKYIKNCLYLSGKQKKIKNLG